MDEFRIAYYDELDDVLQLTSLYYLSLNWPATQEILEEKRQNDDRYVPSLACLPLLMMAQLQEVSFLCRSRQELYMANSLSAELTQLQLDRDIKEEA